MTRDHLMFGSAGSFVVALACFFGSQHLGAAGGVVVLLGVGLLALSMVALAAFKLWGVVDFLRRR